MMVRRRATDRPRIRHEEEEDDETHETDDGSRQDERHSPIILNIMPGNQGPKDVTNWCMRIPDPENQTYTFTQQKKKFNL